MHTRFQVFERSEVGATVPIRAQPYLALLCLVLLCLALLVAAPQPAAAESRMLASGGVYHRVGDDATGYIIGVAHPFGDGGRVQTAFHVDYSETRQTDTRVVNGPAEVAVIVDDRQVRRVLPVYGSLRVVVGALDSAHRPYLLAKLGWHRTWSQHESTLGSATNKFQALFVGLGVGLSLSDRLGLQIEWHDGPSERRSSSELAAPVRETFAPRAVVARLVAEF